MTKCHRLWPEVPQAQACLPLIHLNLVGAKRHSSAARSLARTFPLQLGGILCISSEESLILNEESRAKARLLSGMPGCLRQWYADVRRVEHLSTGKHESVVGQH